MSVADIEIAVTQSDAASKTLTVTVPVERVTTIFRLIRADVVPVSTEVDFL